ncbi:hypothetical protein ACVW0P_003355 [Mucilaginibacter sp. UYNi724]
MGRLDISNWVIHFIHRRNPNNDPAEFSIDPETGDSMDFPDGFTYDGNPIFLTNKYEEEEYGLASDDYAFYVLKKILHDGYIKAGWSYRNFNPTIYGPKAAVCFTEMPLYGLIEYAKSRNAENFIEDYGIAFIKDELFQAGARPVIYGLSTRHKEAEQEDPFFGIGLRNLSLETGIGLKEQYRYVYTNLGANKSTNWTHEREWRWADLNESFDFPGIPLFAANNKIAFSKIIIIVRSTEEAEDVIDYLKNLFHSKSTNYGREYNLQIIANSYVLALEELSSIVKDVHLIKLDDLPLHKLPKIEEVKVSEATLEKVKIAWSKASVISLQASTEFYEEHVKGNEKGSSGFSHIITFDSNSEITQAFINLEIAESYADGYYHLRGLDSYHSQIIDVPEAGMKAAAKFLSEELGQSFSYHSRLD